MLGGGDLVDVDHEVLHRLHAHVGLPRGGVLGHRVHDRLDVGVGEGLDRAEFVVREHHACEHGVRAQCIRKHVGIDQSTLVDRKNRDGVTVIAQRVERV